MTNQKSFVITGANSHIGKGIISYLLKEGNVNLLLTSRSHDSDLENLVSENVSYYPGLDLLDQSKLLDLQSYADKQFDGPFNLVHSVGFFWYHVPFSEVSMKNAKEMMDSHYTTLYGTCQSLLPIMIKKGGGRIIAFSCNSVNFHFPFMAAFTSAKAAVESLIKCIAHEYAQNNIVANSLALSSMQTEVVKASKPFGDYEHYIPISDLCITISELLSMKSDIVNGNTINCYKYSESYYNQGYFQRIKTK
jgi:3-oxoacyl-[acyl-carrier protein] reductase